MQIINLYPKNRKTFKHAQRVHIKRIQKVSYCFFFSVKHTLKLINQQLKNGVKIVNWQKKVSYYFFYYQKYPYLKLKNEIKIVH